jgi:hypothetical protein
VQEIKFALVLKLLAFLRLISQILVSYETSDAAGFNPSANKNGPTGRMQNKFRSALARLKARYGI